MPLQPSQKAVIAAMDAVGEKRAWWAEEIGVSCVSTLSHWAHDTRTMPEDMQEAVLMKVGELRPDLVAEVWRGLLAPMGLTVAPAARPEPAATARRLQSAVTREWADLATAWADADEDGHHDAPELARRLGEIRQLRAALASYETVTAQELAAAEIAAGVEALPFARGAK